MHARHGQRRGDVDPADARPRVRRAQRRAPQHPVGPHVRRVGELALDLRDAVGPPDRHADAVPDLGDRAHFNATSARSRAISSTSPVCNSPRSTTTSPLTITVSASGAGCEHQRPRPGRRFPRGRDRRAATARRRPACRPPASRARRRGRGSARRAACPAPAPRRAVIAAGPPRSRATSSAWRSSPPSSPASLDAAPSTPRPDRRARAHQRHDRRDPRAQPRVRRRAVRDAGPGLAEPRDLALGQVHAVREPDVVAEPPELLEVLDRPHAELLEAERLLLDRLGHVRVQPHAALTRERRRLGHQLARDAERRARRQRDPAHRARLRLVELVQRVFVGGEDRVAVLDHAVRRQPALRDAQIHRAAARVEADAELARRLDLDRQQVAGAVREDVVVVATRSCSPSAAAPRARRAPRRAPTRVDPRPHRIQLDQPLEQRRLLRQPARRVLVEVVVAVDQARRREAAAGVDPRPFAAARGPGPDGRDPVALDHDVPVADRPRPRRSRPRSPR